MKILFRGLATLMGVVALSCALAVSISAQTDWSKIEIKTTKVAGNIYMLEGAGGNIGVSVGPDGILIVDDQYAPLADKIKAALKALGDGKLKFILNTHYHGDHTEGNKVLGPEAPIIAHANVRKRLSTEQVSKFFRRTTPPYPKEALPVITFEQAVSVFFNGEEIKVIHFPRGHTDGDSIIFFTGSNVVHMGDDFFNGFYPFIDQENGGSVRGLIANLDKVLSMVADDAKIIPGHGPLSDKAGLRRFNDVLKATLSAVETAMKAGKSLEQLKADKVLADWDAAWGQGFIKTDVWIDTLHRELSAPRPRVEKK